MEMKIRDGDWDARLARFCLRLWGKSQTFDATMVILAKWTPMAMLALVALEGNGFLLPSNTMQRSTEAAIAAICGAVLARVVNEYIARQVIRPRPYAEFGVIPGLLRGTGSSYPSNHAAGAFALATASVNVPGYFNILLILALCVAVARVYTLVHYATDVLVGGLHGVLTAVWVLWSVHVLWNLFQISV